MIGQHVVSQMRSDGIEDKEARLTMFKVPHKMPVGAERSHMHPYEYNRRAGMALADARSHERDVMDVIQQQTRNPIGGQQMAQVAFNQRERQYVTRDMHLNNSNAPPQQPLSRDFDSRNVYRAFNEDAATRLVDGRGGGAGGYVKGQQLADGQGVHQHLRGAPPSSGSYDRGPPKLVPSSAILGADVRGTWTVDRDQKLEMASHPAVLERAAAMGAETSAVAERIKKHSLGSHLQFGSHELNPGGHRLNEGQHRADDYGIARLRSDRHRLPTGQPGQVAQLLADPDPRAPAYSPHPPNKFAGRSQQSAQVSVSLGGDGAPERQQPLKPFAGRRADESIVWKEQAGAPPPVAPPGHFLGVDDAGGPTVKSNPHAGRITESHTMQQSIKCGAISRSATHACTLST